MWDRWLDPDPENPERLIPSRWDDQIELANAVKDFTPRDVDNGELSVYRVRSRREIERLCIRFAATKEDVNKIECLIIHSSIFRSIGLIR